MRYYNRGISAVITVLLLVMIAVVLIVIVWGVVHNLVNSSVSQSGSCFGNSDKVTFDQRYTCYHETSGTPPTYSVQFSINIGDVNVNGVIVDISGSENSETFTITNESNTIPYLTNSSGGSLIVLPGKNSGSTYTYSWTASSFTDAPTSIELSPIMGKASCPTSDYISSLSNCNILYPGG